MFTNKKHSMRAVMSTILGIISIGSLGIVVYLSYQTGGDVPGGYGITGLLATIYSLIGLILGILTVQEKNYYRFFPWMGVLLNLLALIGIAVLLRAGMGV